MRSDIPARQSSPHSATCGRFRMVSHYNAVVHAAAAFSVASIPIASTGAGGIVTVLARSGSGDDRQRNAARMVIRDLCSARQLIGRMSVAQEERCASIRAGQ